MKVTYLLGGVPENTRRGVEKWDNEGGEARQPAKAGKYHRKQALEAVQAIRVKQPGYFDPGDGQPWALQVLSAHRQAGPYTLRGAQGGRCQL